MSRIGKTPIEIPKGVKLNIDKDRITVSGEKGSLEYNFHPVISLEEKDGKLYFNRVNDSREQKSLHGLTRALVNNMVLGVSEGFERTLHVIGTGYGAEMIGSWIKLSLGYSHDILLEIPEDITVEATTIPRREQGPLGIQVIIKVSGISKENVGKFAAEIRNCRRPAPNFKGKGIRWKDERVRIVSKSGV